MAEDNTPTNVVGEGIELYHSISKGQTVNKNLHAGTYNAALDRASQFYGGEQLYKIANDNLNFIQEQANDLVSELSEQVSFEKVEDFYEVTDGMVTREITITLPTGVEADFNIVAETSNNDLTVKFQDLDGYDGAEIYSETLWDIENEPNSLKSSTSTINIIDDENVAEGLLDEIGLKSQAGDFNLRNGYDLYKVNINPSANVVNIPNTAIFVENGIKKEMSSDFIQGFIERPETVNQYKNVEQIIIDGKSYDITDSFTSAQALQEHFKDADVLVYINDIEDVGSKSYIFMNENSYVLEKINDAQFNTDVANKYIKNNPYETISKLAREEAFTEPERYQVLLDALLNETDTPTNVVDDLITKDVLNEAIEEAFDELEGLRLAGELPGNATHGLFTRELLNVLEAKGFDIDNPENIKRLDNWALNSGFSDVKSFSDLIIADVKEPTLVQSAYPGNYFDNDLNIIRKAEPLDTIFTENVNKNVIKNEIFNDRSILDENTIEYLKKNTDTPTNVVGDEFVDNIVNANTQLVNDLPLSETVKNQFDNVVRNRAKNLATPGGVIDAVDVWEMGVLGLMITAIAYKEFDEIPTIFKRTATNMFNSMTSMYNIPPVPLEQYDLDYEFIEKVITTGEKVMPTDIIIKKVGEIAKGVGEQGLATGFGYVPTTPKNTDTMETTQKIQPGVQEEKMFEQLRPKKTKSAGGSGAKIL